MPYIRNHFGHFPVWILDYCDFVSKSWKEGTSDKFEVIYGFVLIDYTYQCEFDRQPNRIYIEPEIEFTPSGINAILYRINEKLSSLTSPITDEGTLDLIFSSEFPCEIKVTYPIQDEITRTNVLSNNGGQVELVLFSPILSPRYRKPVGNNRSRQKVKKQVTPDSYLDKLNKKHNEAMDKRRILALKRKLFEVPNYGTVTKELSEEIGKPIELNAASCGGEVINLSISVKPLPESRKPLNAIVVYPVKDETTQIKQQTPEQIPDTSFDDKIIAESELELDAATFDLLLSTGKIQYAGTNAYMLQSNKVVWVRREGTAKPNELPITKPEKEETIPVSRLPIGPNGIPTMKTRVIKKQQNLIPIYDRKDFIPQCLK